MSANDRVSDTEYEYACVYCRTGAEQTVAAGIEALFPYAETLIVRKQTHFRQNGRLILQERVLFPGYVFCRIPAGCDCLYRVRQLYDVFSLLTDTEGSWCLTGPDRAFAEGLYRAHGLVTLSQAYFEGDRIRIVSGTLTGYEGNIIRVNRRHQTCEVRFTVQGHVMHAWVGYELTERIDEV